MTNWHGSWQHLSPVVLKTACAIWNLQAVEHVSSSANAVYRAKLDDTTVYLRLCHVAQRDEAFLATGIDWARQLAANGAQVTVPLESRHNNLIERVAGDWLSVLWRGVEGQPLGDTMTSAQLKAWGQALGHLHLASTHHVPQPIASSLGTMQPEQFSLTRFWQNIAATLEPDPQLWALYLELSNWLESLPNAGMCLCHGDFRPANAIWDGRQVWVIDFDEPTLAHPEYDIARACLRDDLQPFDVGHLEVFLRGYEQVLPCKPEWILNYLRVRALLMLAWDMQDNSWGTDFLITGRELAQHGARVARR
jgi:Ser/Thr protein kinase RdoA (MazF antagonist)